MTRRRNRGGYLRFAQTASRAPTGAILIIKWGPIRPPSSVARLAEPPALPSAAGPHPIGLLPGYARLLRVATARGVSWSHLPPPWRVMMLWPLPQQSVSPLLE